MYNSIRFKILPYPTCKNFQRPCREAGGGFLHRSNAVHCHRASPVAIDIDDAASS